MGRIRSIKPSFWDDEKVGRESEGVQLTYIGTWNFADDFGVVKANAHWLKSQIFPYKEKLRIDAFSTWLKRLEELEVVVPVTYRGECFYYIRTFRKHQKVDHPSKARNIPEGDLMQLLIEKGFIFNEENELVKYSREPSRGPREDSPQEGDREREVEREEEKEGGAGGTSPPDPTIPTDEKFQARKKAFGEELIPFVPTYGKKMIRDFFDYWSEPNKGKTKMRKDLERTWDLSRRLRTWADRNLKWDKTPKPDENESRDEYTARRQKLEAKTKVAGS